MKKVMQPNYEFILRFAAQHGGRILDYGCGQGEVVSEGVRRGLEIYGTEAYYHGGSYKPNPLQGTRILPLDGQRIPFADAYFDCVLSNQVFEHVEDLEGVLREIRRVLKPGGILLSLFPSREVWREGHCGVMLAHRLQGPRRTAWLKFWAALGFGAYRNGKSVYNWAVDFSNWIDQFCHYRPLAEIRRAYANAGFSFDSEERSYAVFRLGKWVKYIPGSALQLGLHKYVGLVIRSR